MKRLINILLGAALTVTVASCSSDDLPLADVTSNTENGIALRSLTETNGLDLSSLSSAYTHDFEIDAVDGGLVPETIRVLVGFTDDDETDTDPANTAAPTQFATMDPSDFNGSTTLNTHGLPVGTFSTTLGDILNHLGLTTGDYDRGDIVEFEFEMIATDGTVFNKDNVGSNVAASGRFSFYNSPFEFSAEIDDPNRIVLTDASLGEFSDSKLRTGDTDSVMLTFDSETFTTQPTITRTSAGGFTDDVIGPLTKLEFADANADGTDDNANIFFFLYTAGSAASDDVSFTISGGESTAGFAMEIVEEEIFAIDNVAPSITLGGAGSRLTEETGGEIKAITVDVIFSEDVTGEVTFTVASPTAQFDSQEIVVDVDGDEVASFEFKPLLAGAELPTATVNFTVTASGTNNDEGIDEAGNAAIGTIAINIF